MTFNWIPTAFLHLAKESESHTRFYQRLAKRVKTKQEVMQLSKEVV